MENLKDFLLMSEEEKIRRIKSLDPEEVIRILISVGTNALSAELLNQLAVAYNNSIQHSGYFLHKDGTAHEDWQKTACDRTAGYGYDLKMLLQE